MHYSLVLCCFLVIGAMKGVLARNKSEVFMIHTEGCTIAAMSKVSDSIKHIVSPRVTHTCTPVKKLVASNSTHIWVIQEALFTFNVFRVDTFYCCYRHFAAPARIDDVVYGSCEEFTAVIKVKHAYVRIECYHLDDKMYDDFLIFNSRQTVVASPHDEESYNILILGIESMSRLNFHRTMPLTAKFLKKKGIVELLGYNKLGDNSFPNLFPLLTGLSFDYVKQACVHDNIINTNKCAFIWDKFKKNGYYTALGSDSIAGILGTYEYSLPRIPTHFYLQPFIFESRKLFKNKNYSFHQCMGSQYYYKILLDYIYGLTKQLKLNRLFGMFWEESISHEDLNSPQIMDDAYHNLMINLDKDNYLNKTILILLSDHGMRWGKIVHTKQGRQEERLPLLAILFPEGFKRRYDLAYKNIQQNANLLTTPFDIYETLLDLLNPKSLDEYFLRQRYKMTMINNFPTKSSLFLPVSAKRNCNSVGIAEHWCACRKGQQIKIRNTVKMIAAHNLVVHINRLLSGFPQCHKLTLGHVYEVYLIDNNKQWQIYTAMLKTKPGGAVFDGTLIRSKERWVVSGTVSRLNRYSNQSDCVNDASVKMFCYCR